MYCQSHVKTVSCVVSVKSMTVFQDLKKVGKDGLKTYKTKARTKEEEQAQDSS